MQLNIFTEILHAYRGGIDIKKIKWDFNQTARIQSLWVDLGVGDKAKIKLFRNMVILHIELKPTTNTATY